MTDRPPFGPIERLDSQRLRHEQEVTLRSPRRTASFSARLLFLVMDLVYGKARTLEKFRVLELVARVPYQAWENVAYVAVTHTARQPGFARRIFDRVRISRWEQDNEQWHLLILEELVSGDSGGSWLRNRVIPQVLAFGYYQLSWLTYAIKPAWSYRLNADFEDHAEHEYALLVEEHPEWETTTFDSEFTARLRSVRLAGRPVPADRLRRTSAQVAERGRDCRAEVHVTSWLTRHAAEECCDVTTIGRRSGKAHEIEIWFGVIDDTMYLISGNGPTADWFRNALGRSACVGALGRGDSPGRCPPRE